MISSIPNAAVAAASILFTLTISTVNAQASLQQATLVGCYSSVSPMVLNGTYQYQTSGYCQEQCGKWLEKPAFALSKGSDCYCGDKFPPEADKVDDDECNRPCQGFGTEMCGGMTTFSVYNSGLVTSVDSASEAEASAAATSAGSSTTKAGSGQTTQSPSVVTQAGTTVIVTPTSAASSGSSSEGGASKAGIAAGVVVGVLAIAGCAGGAYFFIRNKKRREIEEEHQRQQAINTFARGGTIKSEHSSADSRLDPTMMYRRQSDGSIADERDLSRRVLKVTNPDRNTMIA